MTEGLKERLEKDFWKEFEVLANHHNGSCRKGDTFYQLCYNCSLVLVFQQLRKEINELKRNNNILCESCDDIRCVPFAKECKYIVKGNVRFLVTSCEYDRLIKLEGFTSG